MKDRNQFEAAVMACMHALTVANGESNGSGIHAPSLIRKSIELAREYSNQIDELPDFKPQNEG